MRVNMAAVVTEHAAGHLALDIAGGGDGYGILKISPVKRLAGNHR